jgi:hypothetical protein
MHWTQLWADFLRFLRGEPVPPLTLSGNVNPDKLADEIARAPIATAPRTAEPGTAAKPSTLAPPGLVADTATESAGAPLAVPAVTVPAFVRANDYIANPALAQLRQVARTQFYTTFPQFISEPPKE